MDYVVYITEDKIEVTPTYRCQMKNITNQKIQ